MKFSLIAALSLLNVEKAQASKCPATINTIDPFNASQYTGRWYDVSSDFRLSAPCTTGTYLTKMNGNIEVKNRGYFWWFFFSYYSNMGEAACNTDGKCWVSFSSSGAKKEGPSNYNILYTDYDNVSMVYSCEDNWDGKTETAFILTREWDLTTA